MASTARKTKARVDTVRVRFAPSELDAARRNAAAEGVPLSTFMRRLAVTARPVGTDTGANARKAIARLARLSKVEADEWREDVKAVRGEADRAGR